MKKFILLTIIISTAMASDADNEKLLYPDTRQEDHIDNYHKTEVADPYRWLEDDNSEETKSWVLAQNKVTNQYLKNIPFRDGLKKRLTNLWNYPKMGNPFKYIATLQNKYQGSNPLVIKELKLKPEMEEESQRTNT